MTVQERFPDPSGSQAWIAGGRMLRTRALCIGPGLAAALAGPLAPDVRDCVACGDPYTGMIALIDDPTDWRVCILDAALFGAPEAACDFLRLLRFDAPPVPLAVLNAPEGAAALADLALGPLDEGGLAAIRKLALHRPEHFAPLAG